MGLLLKAYWKQIIVVCLLVALSGALWVEHGRVDALTVANEALSTKNTSLTNDLTDAKTKIAAYEKSAQEQADNLSKAEEERQRRITALSTQIAALRKQTPPKDCKAASDWAIERKGDLAW